MESYVRVPIFPVIQFTTPKERGKTPVPMIPVSFKFAGREVHVDDVLDCARGVSRKAGGRGFRYVCKVSFWAGDKLHTQNSVAWYDDFLQEWFVEVPKDRAPADWDAATQITDLNDFYVA